MEDKLEPYELRALYIRQIQRLSQKGIFGQAVNVFREVGLSIFLVFADCLVFQHVLDNLSTPELEILIYLRSIGLTSELYYTLLIDMIQENVHAQVVNEPTQFNS